MPTAAILGNIASTISRTATTGVGKNFISRRVMPGIRFSRHATHESACTFATTAIFRKAHAFWGSTGRRLSTIRRRRSPGFLNICGSLSSPRTKIAPQASRDKDALLGAELNLEDNQQVRDTWQFYRDRQLEYYGDIP